MTLHDLLNNVFVELLASFIAGYLVNELIDLVTHDRREKIWKRNVKLAAKAIHKAEATQMSGEAKLEYAVEMLKEESGIRDSQTAERLIMDVFEFTVWSKN